MIPSFFCLSIRVRISLKFCSKALTYDDSGAGIFGELLMSHVVIVIRRTQVGLTSGKAASHLNVKESVC